MRPSSAADVGQPPEDYGNAQPPEDYGYTQAPEDYGPAHTYQTRHTTPPLSDPNNPDMTRENSPELVRLHAHGTDSRKAASPPHASHSASAR